MLININILYPISLFKTILEKTFTNLGKSTEVSPKKISKSLPEAEKSLEESIKIAKSIFINSKYLYIILDQTLIKKIHSKCMEGASDWFDTGLKVRINAFNLLIAVATDGEITIPIDFSYVFSNEIEPNALSRIELAEIMMNNIKKEFEDKKIILLADGHFSTLELLSWCIGNKIDFEMRIANNRRIICGAEEAQIKHIKNLKLKGRRTKKTINALWYGMLLYITANLISYRNNEPRVVYTVSNFKSSASEHVIYYSKRWRIEEMFRTMKQSFGLSDCRVTKIFIQAKHTAAVFFAYSIAQLVKKKEKKETVEDAIRFVRSKNLHLFQSYLCSLDRIFQQV